jgi:hypothetical protein
VCAAKISPEKNPLDEVSADANSERQFVVSVGEYMDDPSISISLFDRHFKATFSPLLIDADLRYI